jgi:hypothetical protein
MKLPVNYIARNLWVRKLTTVLTAGGMALVVFVFAAVLMLDAGLKATLVATGSPDNVVVIRQGAQTEIQSGLTRDQAALIETSPEVARGVNGQPLVSKEVVVLNSLPKISLSSAATLWCGDCPTWARHCARRRASCKAGCSVRARRKSSLAPRLRAGSPVLKSGSSCRSRDVRGQW